MKKISPNEFLEFAKEDFKQGGVRGRVNAYGNLKRAMHAQIDLVLEHFDLGSINKYFPEKFELLRNLNLVSPESLKRINAIRNILEHEYTLPGEDEDKDALQVDVVGLYLENTNNILHSVIKYSKEWKQHLRETYENLPEKAKKVVSLRINEEREEGKVDLSEYPAMFIRESMLDGLLVIGDDAPPAHIVAITDVAMSLQYSYINDIKSKKNNKIEIGQAVLASQVADPTQTNIISIGNPDINPITAEIMGLEFGTKFELEKDTAIIKLYEAPTGKVALILIGYDDEAILAAAQVLANYQTYKLSGTELIVTKG